MWLLSITIRSPNEMIARAGKKEGLRRGKTLKDGEHLLEMSAWNGCFQGASPLRLCQKNEAIDFFRHRLKERKKTVGVSNPPKRVLRGWRTLRTLIANPILRSFLEHLLHQACCVLQSFSSFLQVHQKKWARWPDDIRKTRKSVAPKIIEILPIYSIYSNSIWFSILKNIKK